MTPDTRHDSRTARIRIDPSQKTPHPVSRYLTGKFCEHLGSNIYNGMCAQILRNPTFADYGFMSPEGNHPDGGHKMECRESVIADRILSRAKRFEWPQPEQLVESRQDGLAHWWIRHGARDSVRVSPDAGPHGGRAQRVEVSAGGGGIAQWTHLPLHRIRDYNWRIVVRSPEATALTVSVFALGGNEPIASETTEAIHSTWNTLSGSLRVPENAGTDDAAVYRITLTAPDAGQFVIDRFELWPADHIHTADPDVVAMLKASRLPILRWPGGNFVSGYHWMDGVGDRDARPTRVINAWGGVEPNIFGTDEFVAFCEAVGCEPMICVNAGNGTPAEAADWIEYCNGPADSSMGALRAKNGHPEPYGIRHWEVGNELSGTHQISWTTPAGYSDRYHQFADAMKRADPTITLFACGAPMYWKEDWNERLFRDNADKIGHVTDHILVTGRYAPDSDPLDVYRDAMTIPEYFAKAYRNLEKDMTAAGIAEPKLAITELQLFSRIDNAAAVSGEKRLTPDTLAGNDTLTEALYDTLIYHVACRHTPFIDMVTQSATVNHGGGLRKEKERVFTNPCHHAQTMFSNMADATPVQTIVDCVRYMPPGVVSVVSDIRDVPVIDAVAAVHDSGDLIVSIVHRGTDGEITCEIHTGGIAGGGEAAITQLSGTFPWVKNTLDAPNAVAPETMAVRIDDGVISIRLPMFSVTQIRIPRQE